MVGQLLNYIDRYLLFRCTVRDLERWLLSNLQKILDSGDSKAVEVTNKIDTDLVELGEGLIDEITFRERLQGYLRAYETLLVSFSEAEHTATAHAGTAAETFSDHLVVPGLVEGHRLTLVFV